MRENRTSSANAMSRVSLKATRGPWARGWQESWVDDGIVLHMRAAARSDAAELLAFVRQLSFASRYFRYGRPDFALTREQARRSCTRDRRRGLHLLVFAQRIRSRTIVACGQITVGSVRTSCDLAIVVGDPWQRRGIGRRLLEALIDAARRSGRREMRARTLVTNAAMSSLLRRRGFVVVGGAEAGSIRVARLALTGPQLAAGGTAASPEGGGVTVAARFFSTSGEDDVVHA